MINIIQQMYTIIEENGNEDMEKNEPMYPVGKNVNSHIHYGKQYGGTSQNF